MSKPYSESDLSNQLDSDFSWRLKELSGLKDAIRSAGPATKPALLRALIPMLYAHWEGFIKFAATKYFEFLTIRKLRFVDLERQHYLNRFVPRFNLFRISNVGLDERCKLLAEILESKEKRFSRIDPELINTRSNLSSEVIREICVICGIEPKFYVEKSALIDVLLLKRRNSIAHGEEVYVSDDGLEDLIADCIVLMRTFKDLIENKVYTKNYLAA